MIPKNKLKVILLILLSLMITFVYVSLVHSGSNRTEFKTRYFDTQLLQRLNKILSNAVTENTNEQTQAYYSSTISQPKRPRIFCMILTHPANFKEKVIIN